MKTEQVNINEFLRRFNLGLYSAQDTDTQIDAGWYDWFCRDTSLAAKTKKLTKKLLSLLPSNKIDYNTMYVFFKNNCPVSGNLYDDFRICDLKTGEVIYTITPWVGHKGLDHGKAEVWGKENDFSDPLVSGTWKDVRKFFKGV